MKNITPENTPELAQAFASEIAEMTPKTPPVKHPDDPSLHVKIKMPAAKDLTQTEAALSEAAELSVVSDSFGKGENFLSVQGEMELKQLLDKISLGYQYDWDKHGATIEFRDKHWYAKRAAQIPEAWLDKWRETLRKTGTLDLDGLSEIAGLTQEQVNLNLKPDEILGVSSLFNVIFANRDPLRLYALLSSADREAVFSQAGSGLRSLNANQWSLAEAVLSRRGAAVSEDLNEPITLKATRKKSGKQFDYAFTISAGKNAAPIGWKFTTPLRTPPPASGTKAP